MGLQNIRQLVLLLVTLLYVLSPVEADMRKFKDPRLKCGIHHLEQHLRSRVKTNETEECAAEGGCTASGTPDGNISDLKIPQHCSYLNLNAQHLTSKDILGIALAITATSAELLEITFDGLNADETTPQDFAELGSAISKISSLKLLSFKEAELGDQNAAMLFSTLSSLQLEELDISDCKLTDVSSVALLSTLKGNPAIEKLVLSKNDFTIDGIRTIVKGLKSVEYASLSHLGLGEMKLDATSIDTIAELIEFPGSKLASIDIKGTTSTYSDKSILRLSTAVLSNKHVRMLSVDDRKLDDILYHSALFHLDALISKNAAAAGTYKGTENDHSCGFSQLVVCEKGSTCDFVVPGQCKYIDLAGSRLGYMGSKLLSKAIGSEGVTAEALDISDAKIGDIGAEGLVALFKNTGSLKSISMSSNQFETAAAKTITDAILAGIKSGTFNLLSLDISDNAIGDAGARAFAKVLDKNPTLKILNLDDNKIEALGLLPLVKKLATNSNVRSLSIKGAKFDADVMLALAASMNENTHLSDLSFTHSDWNRDTFYVMDALARNTAKIEGVDTIFMPFEPLKEGDAHCGVDDMAMCSFIGCKYRIPQKCVTIALSDATMGEREMEGFAKKLASNEKVTQLALSGNKIGDEGGKHLARALESNKIIRYLNLNKCNLGDSGIIAIAKSLEKTHIRSLHLAHNSFGANGFAALFKLMKTNKYLIDVNLDGHALTDDAISVIQTSLSEVNDIGRLHTLSVRSQFLSAIGLASFTATLSEHFQLGHVDLSRKKETSNAKEGEDRTFAKVSGLDFCPEVMDDV
jgi:Ran GTPase-activating protein (RanGAP) involved in mRNA processing and transport